MNYDPIMKAHLLSEQSRIFINPDAEEGTARQKKVKKPRDNGKEEEIVFKRMVENHAHPEIAPVDVIEMGPIGHSQSVEMSPSPPEVTQPEFLHGGRPDVQHHSSGEPFPAQPAPDPSNWNGFNFQQPAMFMPLMNMMPFYMMPPQYP